MTMIGTLPVYNLSPAIRNFLPTVSASTIVNGLKQVSSTSTDGQLPIVQIASCDAEFTTKFDYYVQGLNKQSKSNAANTGSKNHTNSQYKCVPFSKYNENTTSKDTYVNITNTDPNMNDIIASYDNTVRADGNPNSTLDPKNILAMEANIGSVVALLAVIAIPIIVYKISNISSD
jgi:hypothetical protein